MAYNSDYSQPFSYGSFGDVPSNGLQRIIHGMINAPSTAPAPGQPGAPSPPISTNNMPPPPPQAAPPQSGLPGWMTGAQLATGPSNGFPQQQMPQQSPVVHLAGRSPMDPGTNPNGSIAGAMGPTSVGGAPLQPQQPQGIMPSAGSGSWGSHGLLPTMMNMAGAGTGSPGNYADGAIRGAQGPTSVGGAPLQQAHPQDQGGLIQRMLGYLGSKQQG